jgi:signal transduction histidine kinase
MADHWGFPFLIHLAALVVQVAGVFFALRLIRLSGRSPSWLLISLGFCLMAARRSMKLVQLLITGDTASFDLTDGLFSLAISATMLAGVVCISPLFQAIKEAMATLQHSRNELGVKVAERTTELRAANVRLSQELEERRRAEQRLQQYAGELSRSNAELEQFAYVASHDLQEPLRMVASFTQLLAKRYQGRLDQDADEFIGFAVEGAERMQSLINDLLAYSRVGTLGKPFAAVDCNVVLSQALENLMAALAESGARVTHDNLPTVLGDEVQLRQVFQNLVANALKFRGPEPPLVHLSSEARADEWLFTVQDNGIGIAPEHQERIFLIFQRLHPRSDYPGTGLGLAVCKKIVERHGGRIWVESKPGAGSTFYFNLPRKGET